MGSNLCSGPEDLAAVSGHVIEQPLLHTSNPRSEGHIVTDLLSSGEAGSHWALGRGLCPGSLGVCATCTSPRHSSALGGDCRARA